MMSEINLRQVILGVLTVVISLVLLVVAAVKLYPTQSAAAPAADEAGQLLALEMGVSSEVDP